MTSIEQRILVKLFIASDDFQYLYNEKDVSNNDPNRIVHFYSTLQQELKKYGIYKDTGDLKKMWRNTREKFCKINLEKIRSDKKISEKSENFYKYFIFLEDYISHKNDKVYITPNKKEIMQEVYDEIMENKYVNDDENLPDGTVKCNDDSSDISSLYNEEYENIDILHGYEDIVQTNLREEKIKNMLQKYPGNRNEENSIHIEKKKDTPSTQPSAIAFKPSGMALKPKTSKLFPLTSVIAPLKAVNKAEVTVGSCRAKYEQIIDNKKEAIVTPIINILNQVILEKESIQLKIQVLQVILNSIKFFCKNHVNH